MVLVRHLSKNGSLQGAQVSAFRRFMGQDGSTGEGNGPSDRVVEVAHRGDRAQWRRQAGYPSPTGISEHRRCVAGWRPITPAGPVQQLEATMDEYCKRCKRPFDASDRTFEGGGQYRDSPWCNACVSRCHEASEFDHACNVCTEGLNL